MVFIFFVGKINSKVDGLGNDEWFKKFKPFLERKIRKIHNVIQKLKK